MATGYHCDGCGKERRGRPYRTARDGEYPDGLRYCFPCVKEIERESERERVKEINREAARAERERNNV